MQVDLTYAELRLLEASLDTYYHLLVESLRYTPGDYEPIFNDLSEKRWAIKDKLAGCKEPVMIEWEKEMKRIKRLQLNEHSSSEEHVARVKDIMTL